MFVAVGRALSGSKDRGFRCKIRISFEVLSSRNVRHLRWDRVTKRSRREGADTTKDINGSPKVNERERGNQRKLTLTDFPIEVSPQHYGS